MATNQQLAIPGAEQFERRPASTMDLLAIALNNNAAIDVIERLAALQRQERDKDAEIQFTEAMNGAQSELGRIGADLTNIQTHSKYASYAALDRKIRPIYVKHGFSLSFNTEASEGDTVCVLCYVSHTSGHSRTYRAVMPADGKGAKGGDVMTKTHATGAAMSYGMRYLLKMIFNVAVGEEDDDGNMGNGWAAERVEWMDNCRNIEELRRVYAAAFKEASAAKDYKALAVLTEKHDQRKKAINDGH